MRRALPWRLILCVLIVGGAGLSLFSRLGNLELLGRTLQRAQLAPLLLALALQILTLINQPAFYQSLYTLVGVPIRWRDLAPLVWAGHFLNVATPSAGLGGTALLLSDARRQGLDASRVSLANSLYFLLNFAWFGVLLALGMATLWARHDLHPAEIGAAAILFIGVVLALCALVGVALAPKPLERALIWAMKRLSALLQRVLKRDAVPEANVRSFVAGFAGTLAALGTARGRLVRPIFHAIGVDSLEIGVLGACFWAFPGAGAISLWTLVAGYSIGTLFLVVSVTPQGLGVVEGVMTATFVSLGVPLERAAVVVLAYRGLSFWAATFVRTSGFAARFAARFHIMIAPSTPPVEEDDFAAPLPSRAPRHNSMAPRLAAALVALMGLLNVWSAITPGLPRRMQILWDVLPFDARRSSHLAATLLGFALLLLAHGLWRRKGVSWALSLGTLVISVLAHLLKGLDFEEAFVALALAAWLWSVRRHFPARSDAPSIKRGLQTLAFCVYFHAGVWNGGVLLAGRCVSRPLRFVGGRAANAGDVSVVFRSGLGTDSPLRFLFR